MNPPGEDSQLPQHGPPEDRSGRTLQAGPEDPQVSAFTLSEYVYCPRAGLITHEAATPDPGDELPPLGLLPWYELQAIEETWERLFLWCCASLVAFVAAGGIALFMESRLIRLAGVAGMLGSLYLFVQLFIDLSVLSRRRLAHLNAAVCEPDSDCDRPQPVNWWGLLRAGFEPDGSPCAIMDEKLRLSGRPRQILRKGSLAIPVFRTKKRHPEPKEQHRIRTIAYCRLLEAATGAWSPFGIVLLGDSYQGFTVPNTRRYREPFMETLRRVRQLIRRCRDENLIPAAPASETPCLTCPHGNPRSVREGQPTIRDGQELPPFILLNGNGQEFHCNCGDRFGWKPLHQRNRKLRARS